MAIEHGDHAEAARVARARWDPEERRKAREARIRALAPLTQEELDLCRTLLPPVPTVAEMREVFFPEDPAGTGGG